MRRTFTVPEKDRGRRLDLFLAEKLPELSRSRIQLLLESGKVMLQYPPVAPSRESRVPIPELAKPIKAGYRLRGGEQVSIEIEPPAPLRAFAEALPLEILYEDEDLVAINKPAGMVVHIGAGVKSGTLVNALLHHFRTLSEVGGPWRPGIVHRLDRNTSGVLLVAKNDAAHRRLAEQFAGRTMEKHYLALVHGDFARAEGVIRATIRRHPVRRTRMAARPTGGRPAESHYRVLGRYKGFSLLDVRIVTGRTHQVRVHLSSIGHPVVGDTLYGAPARLPAAWFPSALKKEALSPEAASRRSRKPSSSEQEPTLSRNFLHAERIRFLHPRTGTPLEIRAPLPAELEAFLSRLIPLQS